jgi:O-antigen/teichoic acid export membrane protein
LTVAEPIVLILYGAKWHEAVPFVEAFSVTMFFYAIAGVISPLLWAQGAIHKDARIQAVMAMLIAAGSIVMSWWSALAVAWWVAAVFGMRAIFLLSVGAKSFSNTRSILLESIFRGTVFLSFAAAIFRGSDWLLRDLEFSVAGRFSSLMLIFILLMFGVVKAHRLMGKAFTETMLLISGKLPMPVRRMMNADSLIG